MSKLTRSLLPVLSAMLLWSAISWARASAVAAPAPAASSVFVLPVTGPIDKGMLYVFRRAFRLARSTKPAAIVIVLDTPGGRLKETNEIVNWIRSVDVPVYAYVNPNALSAGAIISLGTDAIYMSPQATIGSAMPIALSPFGGGVQELPAAVREKMLSAVRAQVRGLAQENGYSAELAEAMVDPAKELRIGDRVICPQGELLNLTARESVEIIPPSMEPLLAQAVVDDLEALLEHAGLAATDTVRFEETAAERLARFITLVGPLLLALGVLGIYIEVKTPGFGLPGILGITALLIYFFGHYVAGLAGMEDIALVLLGVVLLGVEIFLIPGFGIIGFLGILCLGAGFVLGMVPYLPADVPPLPGLESGTGAFGQAIRAALMRFLLTVGVVGVVGWLLSRILPATPIYRNLVLQKALLRRDGYVSGGSPASDALVSQEGITTCALRPAGIAMIGDERVDVVSSGDLIAANARVRVVRVEGSRIVVEAVPDEGS